MKLYKNPPDEFTLEDVKNAVEMLSTANVPEFDGYYWSDPPSLKINSCDWTLRAMSWSWFKAPRCSSCHRVLRTDGFCDWCNWLD